MYDIHEFYDTCGDLYRDLRDAPYLEDQITVMTQLCNCFLDYLPIIKYEAYELNNMFTQAYFHNFRNNLILFHSVGWADADYFYTLIFNYPILAEDVILVLSDIESEPEEFVFTGFEESKDTKTCARAA
jgi:hypothetical protein